MLVPVRYNVTLVDPPTYKYAYVLADICRIVASGIRSLGFRCDLSTNNIDTGATNIIVGTHLLTTDDIATILEQRPSYITLQSEWLLPGDQPWLVKSTFQGNQFEPMQRRLLEGAVAVWEAWESNIALLSRFDIPPDAGDFRLIEWLYDLEDAKDDPCQPAIVNCLDHLMSTIPGTATLWERRRWFEGLLHQEYQRCHTRLRILDVAAGGARYVRDFLAGLPSVSGVDVTLVDQDPAATAFCQAWSAESRGAELRSHSLPISRLAGALRDREFDVVLSAGLFDYLNDSTARTLLDQLSFLLAPDGVLAFPNFHPDDPSSLIKGWLVDWNLLYRDEPSCTALLPGSLSISTARSATRALSYALGRRSAGAAVTRL